jgi:CoA:oxalate CoA-transferase
MTNDQATGADVAPLSGIRVVEFTENMVGPYAGFLLATLGAEVIKVERPAGESMRFRNKGLFVSINRGKKSVALDLKKDEDRAIALELIKSADVVTESFRPGVAEKLGIGFAAVAKVNPRAVYLSISAYGQDGPRKTAPAYDPVIAAFSGIVAQMGAPGKAPEYDVGMAIADFAPVFAAVISIQGALMQREKTGQGQYLDLSMLESALLLLMTRFGHHGMEPNTDGRRARVGSGVFAASDGKYFTIHAPETHFWNALLDVVGLDDLESTRDSNTVERQKDAEAINGALRARFTERSRDEWVADLSKAGIPVGPVLEIEEVFADEQLKARDAFVETGGIRFPRFPVRMSGVNDAALETAHELGADNDAVLASIPKAKA